MEKRQHPRTKKRMSCGLTIEGRQYTGFVLDISVRGLYVQTSARPAPGTPVEVELGLPTQRQPLHMRAKAARQKLVPPELRSIAKGGIGLQLEDPPEAFAEYHASLMRAEPGAETPAQSGDAPAAAADRTPPSQDSEPLRYRVRVSQMSGPRSRTITVACETLEEAKQAALEAVGEGWKVLSADPV